MGWRISFYLVTKKMADKIKNMTEEEYHKNEVRLCRNLGKKCIWYDTMTDLIARDKEQKFSTELFSFETDDIYYGEISKDQLKNLIMASREKTINYLSSVKAEDYIAQVRDDWEYHFPGNATEREWFANLDFSDNKFLICHGHTYEHAIYDLMHIYKSINWKTHVLLCIGS